MTSKLTTERCVQKIVSQSLNVPFLLKQEVLKELKWPTFLFFFCFFLNLTVRKEIERRVWNGRMDKRTDKNYKI